MRFLYSVVRFVPDPARGEQVNVGVIVGSEESHEWQVRQLENAKRARQIDDANALEAAWDFLNDIGRHIDQMDMLFQDDSLNEGGEATPDEAWLLDLARRHRNVIQLTPPTPLSAESIEEATDRIASLMLLRPTQRDRNFVTKHRAFAAVNSGYTDLQVRQVGQVIRRPILQTEHHQQKVDFAVANGRVVQLTHTWSFNLPDQAAIAEQVKAWGWTIGALQQDGGQLLDLDRRLRVDPDVDVEVVFVPPPEGMDAPAFEDAQAVFEKVRATAQTLERATDVASRALELLGASPGKIFERP